MGAGEPLVTVVVPAYNARRTITATLASIESQTISDLEIVVVDDGSTDDTVPIAEATAARSLRIVSQANAGHAAARNTGVSSARGRYVAFLDADDLWLPNKLERQLQELEHQSSIRAIQSGAARVDNELQLLWIEECRPAADQLHDTLRFRNMPALMSTLVVERSLFEEIGGFDPSLVILQDWDLAIRLARRGQLHSVTDVLAAYRLHASQSSSVEIHIEPGLRILNRLFGDPQLPVEVRRQRNEVYAAFYAMLSGGSVKVGRYPYAVYWGMRALLRDPRVVRRLAGFPARRLRRRNEATTLPRTLAFPAAVITANAGQALGVSP